MPVRRPVECATALLSLTGAIAEYECNLIRERTTAGLVRARGRLGSRPKALSESQMGVTIALTNEGDLTIKEICEQIAVAALPTIVRSLPTEVLDAVPLHAQTYLQ